MTYEEMREICSKFWLTKKDIMLLCGCGRNNATELINSIRNDLVSKGINLPKTKYKIVPTQSVLEHLGIDNDYKIKVPKNA